MKKLKSVLMSLVVVVTMAVPSLGIGLSASAYTIDYTYNATRINQKTNPKYIVLHETGGIAPAVNNAIYFNREWANVQAYTSFVVGDSGKVYQVSPPGLIQWGGGSYEANVNSPVQIELARTNNKTQFKKDYAVYINLARDMAKKYNIPLTLDTAYPTAGIKTHYWLTMNIAGDHTDPYGYLASMGISKTQLAADLKTGLPEDGSGSGGGNGGGNNGGEVKPPVTAPSYESKNGSYTFTVDTKIRNGVGVSGVDTGLIYEKGQSVNYDRIYKDVDGYDWLSYVSYSGTRRYVAMVKAATPEPKPPVPPTSGWTEEYATFTAGTTINVRSSSTTTASIVAQYKAGQSVSYEAKKESGGYVWIRYTSYSGQKRYMAVRTYQNGVRGKLWGTIN